MSIRFEHIVFRYEIDTVLNGVSGDIEKGGFAALVGPNGSGKSTLIKCLNGILQPESGTVFIEEEPLDRMSARKRAQKTGYVPQSEQYAVPYSVFDTVLLGRKPHFQWQPSKSDLEITASILEALGLARVSTRSIRSLSGGQRQKVYIARALAQEPSALLLDEPTANLDMRHQVEVLELLSELSEEGMTIIMAMHDINLAGMYCDRFIMLKEGRVFQSGGKEAFTAENISRLYDVDVQSLQSGSQTYLIPTPFQKNTDNDGDIPKTHWLRKK